MPDYIAVTLLPLEWGIMFATRRFLYVLGRSRGRQ